MKKATTIKEVLIAARWILNRLGWTQRTNFRDSQNEPTATPTKAVSVCPAGAIELVETEFPVWKLDAIEILNNLVGGSVMTWNDSDRRTKEEVLSLFDKAIKQAGE